MREETCCRHIGYSYRLSARVLLYAPSHRQYSTYHSLYFTSRGALAGMKNSSMGPLHEGSIRRPIAPWANALTTELHLAPRRQELTDVSLTILHLMSHVYSFIAVMPAESLYFLCYDLISAISCLSRTNKQLSCYNGQLAIGNML